MISNTFTPKKPHIFNCVICDFHTSNKKDYKRHNETIKHKTKINQSETILLPQKTPSSKYVCICGKLYSDNSGLWRHKKKCNANKDDKQKQLVEYLLTENSEFKQLMIEQNKSMVELAKNAGHNTTNNNQQFNLNFFLNETCKNAMNIMDFVNQLQIKNNDLEETGRLGFSNGISRIFINGLKQINIPDRPIHCSDFKRETLYIKNNNEWNKETDEKIILTNAIKQVTHKNMKQITEWTKTHPEYKVSSSKVNDKYLNIVSESMSGSTEDETNKNYSKIVKNILKETVIDK
jgi:hypothetical protein